jgi:outer membrane protein OmpA-like peptidoglycan-associated protein/tetratricopeptide (TPR) repeat protein
MKNLLIFLAIVLIACHSVTGQSSNISTLFQSNLRKADNYFSKLQYQNAVEFYKRVLEKDSSHFRSKLRLAESYMILKDPDSSAIWYDKIMSSVNDPSKVDPDHYYNYAQVLSSIERYEEALSWYEIYAALIPSDPRNTDKIQFLKNMDYYLSDSNLYELIVLPFNSDHSDFGSKYYDSGFVFISSRDKRVIMKNNAKSAMSEKESPLNLYYVEIDSSGSYQEPGHFKKELKTRFHEGPLAFYSDNRKVIFTRNNYHEGKKTKSNNGLLNVGLFTAEMDENLDWKNIEAFEYNHPDYSAGHPSLSEDNQRLYFSSNMPGGLGGNDIYVSYNENGKWGNPINLGPEINTPGDEMFPYISDDSTLYFASDGWGGFGSLDIFRALGRDSIFLSAYNLGFPINTNKDDFALIINEKERSGYFSSDREGGKGFDDIYAFNVKSFKIHASVLELFNKEPIPDVLASLINIDGDTIDQKYSDNDGRFQMELPFDSEYTIKLDKDEYTQYEYIHLSTLDRKSGIDSPDYYMWKHELFSAGIIYNNETHFPMPNVLVLLHNQTDNVFDSTFTDDQGKYVFPLQPDKTYDVIAEKEGYLAETLPLMTNRVKKGTILNDFVLESEYIEKVFVYFDFDKSNIKSRFNPDIERMVNLLNKYPDSRFSISAHADARGSHAYNEALSDRRANSVKRYIIAKGIDASRIDTMGFGERLILNRCVDGVNCREIDHSINRRAELKVEFGSPEQSSASNLSLEYNKAH